MRNTRNGEERCVPLPTEDHAEHDPEKLPTLVVERVAEVQRLK